MFGGRIALVRVDMQSRPPTRVPTAAKSQGELSSFDYPMCLRRTGARSQRRFVQITLVH
jgi:hypothetical protein